MKNILLLFFCAITLVVQAQKSTDNYNISTNVVFLCGPQDVYEKANDAADYHHTYKWPEGTYTMFEIEEQKKKISFYTVSPIVVNAARSKFTKEIEIVKYVMTNTVKPFVIEYEILDKLDPVYGLNGNQIMGYLYTLKLSHQTREQANTTIQLRQGIVRYSSVGATGIPYRSDYPILHSEAIVSGLDNLLKDIGKQE